MVKTVVGSFDSFDEARRVARDLIDDGFMESDINVIANNAPDELTAAPRAGDVPAGMAAPDRGVSTVGTSPTVTRYTVDPVVDTTPSTAASTVTAMDRDTAATDPDAVRTHEHGGAATGAVTGGVIGGAAGLAASLMSLTIPGIGPIIAAGPIVATLTGVGVGAVAGGLIGGLTDLGVSHEHAQYYSEALRRGGALVTVRADESRAERAADIMREHGAIDIDRRVERWRESGWRGYDADAQPYSRDEIQRERDLYAQASDSATGVPMPGTFESDRDHPASSRR